MPGAGEYMPDQTLSLHHSPDRSLLSGREAGTLASLLNVERESHELSQYFRVLKRHSKLIATIFAASVIAAIVVTRLMPRRYTATNTILIEPREPQALSLKDLSTDSQDASDDDYYYETQYQILKSRTLAHQVILELGLDAKDSFAKWARKPGLMASLKDMLGHGGVAPEWNRPTSPRGMNHTLLTRILTNLRSN